jgi:hypothetical protein
MELSSISFATGSISSADIANWNTNYQWYLVSSGGMAYVFATTGNWDTAYSWGDHAGEGYLKAGSNVSALANDSGYVSTNTFDAGTNGAVVAANAYTDAATQGLQTAIAGTVVTNGANISVLANDSGFASTNYSDSMATKTNWGNAVVDGNIGMAGYGLTNAGAITATNLTVAGNSATNYIKSSGMEVDRTYAYFGTKRPNQEFIINSDTFRLYSQDNMTQMVRVVSAGTFIGTNNLFTPVVPLEVRGRTNSIQTNTIFSSDAPHALLAENSIELGASSLSPALYGQRSKISSIIASVTAGARACDLVLMASLQTVGFLEGIRISGVTGFVGIGTNWPSSKIDVNGTSTFRGTMNLATNSITNVTCLALGTTASGLGRIIMPASTSTNDGLRFGDDTYLYRSGVGDITFSDLITASGGYAGGGNIQLTGSAPYIYSIAQDIKYSVGPGKRHSFQTENGVIWCSTNSGTLVKIGTGTSASASTNALEIGAGTNLLTLGQGGPVVITGTNYMFYNSATNCAYTWADYVGVYHAINSNGTIRIITNVWGF